MTLLLISLDRRAGHSTVTENSAQLKSIWKNGKVDNQNEYDIEYRNQTNSKSQVLEDFLIELPLKPINNDLRPAKNGHCLLMEHYRDVNPG